MTALPKTAPAIVLDGFGGPEKMTLGEAAVTPPGPNQIVIKVAAAGVNRADSVQRMGMYPPPKGESEIIGLEVAGTVAAVGDGVTRYKEGDAVCALLAGGGYAHYCTVDARQVLPVPSNMDMVQAAALPECIMTVWTNVFERGRLQPGETLLVHGGSSGIGTFAISIAHALGSTVFATAGSADKCAACEKLGAKRAINYKSEDFVDVIQQETGGRGVDVVLDMVGGDYVTRDIGIMALEGRHVSIAALGGGTAEIPIMQMMLKRLTFTGSTLRARTPEQKGAVASAVEQHVWPLVEAGKVLPIIDSTFPLAEVAEAHRRIESSQHIGKIVLTMD